ncbi:MAG: DNA-methyltransferase [Planctomycetota bacterium]
MLNQLVYWFGTNAHPTQKALELAERAIRNSSRRGDIVFDPFLGSGTTLIAAARLGRRCFGMEIEPRYCDCIVRRYIALAGHKTPMRDVLRKWCIFVTNDRAVRRIIESIYPRKGYGFQGSRR